MNESKQILIDALSLYKKENGESIELKYLIEYITDADHLVFVDDEESFDIYGN